MQLNLKPYSELLTMGKEALEASLAPKRAKSQHKKAELELAKLDETCATLEQKITESCSAKEINFNQVLEQMDELDLADRKRKQLEELLAQLFPTATSTP